MKGEVRDVQDPCYSEARPGILQQLQARKYKMIQLQRKRHKGSLDVGEEQKLKMVSGKLKRANMQLMHLLAETDKETIKEDFPKVARAKCLEACEKATNTYWAIQQSISKKRSLNIDDLSAGMEAVKKTKAMLNLLQAVVDSMQP